MNFKFPWTLEKLTTPLSFFFSQSSKIFFMTFSLGGCPRPTHPYKELLIIDSMHFLLCIFFILMFIYFWETEGQQERDRERGRHRIWSRLQALSCQHRAWHGAPTHELWNPDPSWSGTLNWLSHPGAPILCTFIALPSIISPLSRLRGSSSLPLHFKSGKERPAHLV